MIYAALLLFIPISFVLAYLIPVSPLWVFAASAIAIVPLAEYIRQSTDHLAAHAGSAIGGLLNVTFGSIAELTLALFVLAKGHTEIVKAQITGSLIGTSLLGLGLAIIAGSIGRERQTFKRERAALLGSMLILSVIALLLPALFDYTERGLGPAAATRGTLDEELSLAVSVLLIAVYIANLIYTLVTHRDVFATEDKGEAQKDSWPLSKSIGILLGCTAVVALESDLIARSLDATAGRIGLTPLFLGVIVLAVIGNAAEIIAATYFARQDRMGLVMGLCVGSTVQVALLLAPVLVIISYFMGNPINLVFSSPLELIAIVGAAFTVNSIAGDGETTWFEGALLVTVYCMFAVAFYFVQP